ncbi:MAG TPA: hypothetical protein VI197_30345 [Polyangiaceae bacterium]
MDDPEGSKERQTHLPDEPPEGPLPPASMRQAPPRAQPRRDSTPPDEVRRPSVLDALRQSETTLHEVGKVAERLSVVLGRSDAHHLVRQIVISFVAGLTLALMVAVVFAGGALKLVLGILAGTCAAALAMFCALRVVSKLAARFGAKKLPGSPWLWVSAVLLAALGGTAAFGIKAWEVAETAGALRIRSGPEAHAKAATESESKASSTTERADATMKRGSHIGLERGVLYAPASFESADGQFDLVLHFHGNTDLVEQSVASAKLNALVAIINVGDGAEPYSKALQNPYTFDRMLTTIERRAEKQLHLEHAQIRRIALSAWSAGFASVGRILSSRSQLDRVDAVLLLDSPHAKFAPFSETEVYPPSLENFANFARRAVAGRKLMVITHSAIETEGYPSTTLTTDALLAQLSLKRTAVTGNASPPPVDIPVAKRAFPDGERNWLNVVSQAHEKDFYLYGCTGKLKGDHIAHLAQMSVTVLPLLRDRWQPATEASSGKTRVPRAVDALGASPATDRSR